MTAQTKARDVGRGRSLVAVVGAGASGVLVTIQLLRLAERERRSFDVVIIDPVAEVGRGVAYSTNDHRHLLNVPAGAMSALPDRPDDFVCWLRRELWWGAGADDFAPRGEYGRYLASTLSDTVAATPSCTVTHRRTTALSCRLVGDAVRIGCADGTALVADAVVLATGIRPPGTLWAPAPLASSPWFVADPWARGTLDAVRCRPGDVLLVGTGLTMVDVALRLARPGRVVHAVSRRGRVPAAHTTRPVAEQLDLADLHANVGKGLDDSDVRRLVGETVQAAVRRCRDWRAAFDALRPHTAGLWARLDDNARATLLRDGAAWWDLHRHRMPPSTAAGVHRLRRDGLLEISSDEVVAAEDTPEGLRIRFASGGRLNVATVVNCTGPDGATSRSADPLMRDLLDHGIAVPGPLDLGVRTRAGRLLDASGSHSAPMFTLGNLRRGELWESTAIPEIRAQAMDVASQVSALLPSMSEPRRGCRDVMGLALTTTREAAAAFNRGLDAVMLVQSGAAEAFHESVTLDPGFALGHAALAMLGHEGGADAVDVQRSLAAARSALHPRMTERERSLVEVVAARVADCRGRGAAALVQHVLTHPRDVLAVSAAVPTIAFSGVTDVQQEAWELVEGLGTAYGDHWWHRSLLAFVRQDQGRYDDAGALAEQVLAQMPEAGHAVHAQTHVYYETGAHEAGLAWLDPWITSSGRKASHLAHFSWHAALHELSRGDCDAVRRRYLEQLAPPAVTGVRGLVDSASLLWRCTLTGSWRGPVPIDEVLAHAGPRLLDRPETPFTAMHAAVALAAAGDNGGMVRLRDHALASNDVVLRDVVAPLCDGLAAVVEERWDDAISTLGPLLPRLVRVGGSLAQREVIEDTQLFALVSAGRCDDAVALIDARLDRRPSELDLHRRAVALAH